MINRTRPTSSRTISTTPFHGNGKACTALSCVVLLGDAPAPVLGRLLSNFWDKDDQGVSDFLNEQILECVADAKESLVRRAGHVTFFPLGTILEFVKGC